MKKLAAIFLLTCTLIIVTGCKKDQPADNPDTGNVVQEPTPTPPETQLPPEERPTISFTTDEDIQNALIKITDLPADVTMVEYEITYQTKGASQGFIGTYRVDAGEISKTLGTCSSGVCKYDEDITDLTLTIKYRTNGERVLLREKAS